MRSSAPSWSEAGAGHLSEAATAYSAAVKVWAEGDSNLPALKEARAWLAAHRQPMTSARQ